MNPPVKSTAPGSSADSNLLSVMTVAVAAISVLLIIASADMGIVLIPLVIFGAILLWSIFRTPVLGLLLMYVMIFSGLAAGLELPGGYLSVAALASFAWFVDRTRKFDLSFHLTKQQTLFIALWLSTMLVSVPLSLNQKTSLLWLVGYLKVVILFFLTVNLLSTKGRFKLLLLTVLVTLVLSFAYGMYSLFLGARELTSQGVSREAISRLQGLSADPNHFAASLLIFVPLPFFSFFWEKKKSKKLLWLLLLAVLVAAIVTTFSRGGLISLVFLLLLLAIKQRHRPAVIWATFITILLILIMLPPDFWERLGVLSNLRGEGSARWRVKHAMAAVHYFADNPILGIGIGSYWDESIRHVPVHQPVHNMYLEVAAETGIIGLVAFLGLLGTTIKYFDSSRILFREQGDQRFALLAESLKYGFYGFLFAGLFLSIQMDVLFWSQLGLAGALRSIAEMDRQKQIPEIASVEG